MNVTKQHVRVASALMTLIGLGYLWRAWSLPFGDPAGTGAGAVPVGLGVLWVLFGLHLTVRPPDIHVHDDDVGTWPDGAMVLRLVAVFVLCAGFVVALSWLGMLVTSAVFMALMARLGGAGWVRAIATSIVLVAALWLIFVKVLQLSFPAGSLFQAWMG